MHLVTNPVPFRPMILFNLFFLWAGFWRRLFSCGEYFLEHSDTSGTSNFNSAGRWTTHEIRKVLSLNKGSIILTYTG